MAYYYVKPGGTATGDGGRYATKKTGSWSTAFTNSSQYYGTLNLDSVATTIPVATDIVCVSHLSDFTSTINDAIFLGGLLFSVDDNSVNTPKKGAIVHINSDLPYYYGCTFVSSTLDGGADLADSCDFISSNSNTNILLGGGGYTRRGYYDCTFTNIYFYGTDNTSSVRKCSFPTSGFNQGYRGTEFIGCHFPNSPALTTRSDGYDDYGNFVCCSNLSYNYITTREYKDYRTYLGPRTSWVGLANVNNPDEYLCGNLWGNNGDTADFNAAQMLFPRTNTVCREKGASFNGYIGTSILLNPSGTTYINTTGRNVVPIMVLVGKLWDNWSSGKVLSVYGLTAGTTCALNESLVWLEAYYKSSATATDWKYGSAKPNTLYVPDVSSAASVADSTTKWRTVDLSSWDGTYSTQSNAFKVSLSIPSGGGEGPLLLFLRCYMNYDATKRPMYICPNIEVV